MKYIFTSERLGFREWREPDLQPFSEMNADKKVMEYFSKTLTKSESDNFVEKIKLMFSEYDYGLYAVDELSTKEFIGFIGYWHPSIELDFSPFVEIGWRIKPEKWNNGYATEGATACLDFGFGTLGFEEIYSLTSKTNLKSERIMQKIGMRKIAEFEHPHIELGSSLKTHVLYKIEKG